MPEIGMRVTSAVLKHLESASADQRQIALSDPSPDLAADIAVVSSKNQRRLVLGGCLEFVIADRGALWRAHNADRVEDFDALFGLLARRPGRAMRVLCELR